MKAEIVTFPFAAAEGLPVLRLDFEGARWDTEAADAARLRHGGARGLWGVWPTGLESWEDRALDTWIDEQPRVIAMRDLEAPDWPAAELNTVLDLSEAMKRSSDIDSLATYVSKHAGTVPIVNDISAVLGPEQRPPLASALDLLTSFAEPSGWGYIYAPDDHPQRPLILRAITQCASLWSLRSSG